MGPHTGTGKLARLTFSAAAFLSAISNPGLAQKQPASTQNASVTWKLPAGAVAADYAGMETCAACHQEQAGQFAKTVHASAARKSATFATNCESCHGPGKAHADGMMAAAGDAQKTIAAKKLIFSFQGKPTENAAHCLNCHGTSHDQTFFDRSQHKLAGVSCEQCHSAHLVVPASTGGGQKLQAAQAHFFAVPTLPEENRWLHESLLRKSQPALCFGCHATIQAKFALPTHHRVVEGLMKCTDCHSPHGTLNPSQLKKVNFEACVACHTEKRGPWVYEHPAVRVEGCTSCHSPHGTVEPHLLLRSESRFLCLQCHVDPHAANVPHGRLGFQTSGDCIRCHDSIHGSNTNQYLLQ